MFFMKQRYLQIFHQHSDEGWKPGTFNPISYMKPTDAQNVNEHFQELGIRCVKESEYKKFYKNEILVP